MREVVEAVIAGTMGYKRAAQQFKAAICKNTKETTPASHVLPRNINNSSSPLPTTVFMDA